MDEKLLHKWLNDDLSPAERKAVEQDPDFGFYQAILQDAAGFKADQFSAPYSFESLEEAVAAPKTTKLRYLQPMLRIAAVLVIALGVYFTLFNDGITTVETAMTEQRTVILPDASEVILNAASSLSFDGDSWDKARQVNLDGEAYFKVAKGQKFDVMSSQGKVTVLGTQFKVIDRGSFFEVVCYEGRVAVTDGDALQPLNPGDAIRFLDGEARLYNVNNTAPSWLAEKSDFDAVPLAMVLRELERQYNITVKTQLALNERQFSGTFTHKDLEQALNQITAPLQLTYNINGKEVTIGE